MRKIRNVKAKLSSPVTALRRIQDLAGLMKAALSDRNENRAAQLSSIQQEIFDIVVASLGGNPLPKKIDHSRSR